MHGTAPCRPEPANRFLRAIPLLGWLAICGCGSSSSPQAQGPTEKPLPTLQTAVLEIHPQTWPKIVRSQGSLVADEVAAVGTRVAGRVDEVHVDLGDFVKQGEVLAVLDQEEFLLAVEQAEAQLAQARSAVGLRPEDSVASLNPLNAPPVRQEKAVWDEAIANLNRSKRLRQENAMSAAEYDQIAAAERVAEARYASALNSVYEKIALINVRQAELSLAKQRLADATIRAPFDGLIQQRQIAPGAYVQVGDQIATLVRTNPLRFRGLIPERHAQHLAMGQTVRLKVESVPKPLTVAVTRISPSLDQFNRSLLFEASIDNQKRDLRTGLFAEAEIVIDPNAQSLIVPESAVSEFAGAEKVWKVKDGIADEVEILTGERRDGNIQILQGVEDGDVILLDAAQGQVARIEPTKTIVPSRTNTSGFGDETPPRQIAQQKSSEVEPPQVVAQPTGLSE